MEVTFKDGQEITIVFGDGPPITAKWLVMGFGAPQLKLEHSIEVNYGGGLATDVKTIHVRP
jgi:hypothetical protein